MEAEGHRSRPSGLDARAELARLLNGLSDDDTIWTRRTSIERYAAPLGLAHAVLAGVDASHAVVSAIA